MFLFFFFYFVDIKLFQCFISFDVDFLHATPGTAGIELQ